MVPHSLKRFGRRVRIGSAVQHPSFVVRLPDGRSIAVEEYGDPKGPVVLYFHGWPACRLEAGLIPDLPVRMLAFDRPGYGRSTPQPGRRLLDWPTDVADVADRLGLERFHIVGLSGGGPYAAACAYALGDRVKGMALVSPVPPSTGMAKRTPGVGHLFRLGRHPTLAHRLFTLARPLLRRRIITPSTIVGRGLPESDRAALTRSTMAGLARVWREGFGHGIQGALSDSQIYAHDWGVPLEQITVPTSIWYGRQDSLIPEPALAPYRQITNARWHIVPGEGHYSLVLRHAHTMLEELVGERGQLSSSLSQ